ncbi:unnamed protein product [Pleuronectes platessa]|uniref:Uncharacterized protein n=1 Tax=Pleuronectes platessa TaxID=8262 RepID=A0A9N7W4C8_PLEPL|nr:unnamed protein product [Pleuronectes platessa]
MMKLVASLKTTGLPVQAEREDSEHVCSFIKSKSISELSRPARHTGGTSPSVLAVTHKAPGQESIAMEAAVDVRERQSGRLAVLKLTCPLSGRLSLELIVNPIKAGNSAY